MFGELLAYFKKLLSMLLSVFRLGLSLFFSFLFEEGFFVSPVLLYMHPFIPAFVFFDI